MRYNRDVKQYTYILLEDTAILPVSLNNLMEHIKDDVPRQDIYTDTGVADAYILNNTNKLNIATLATGLRIRFEVTNVNTGASTVNVDNTGVKNLFMPDGTTSLVAGVLIPETLHTMSYDTTLDSGAGAFKMIKPSELTDDEKEYDYAALILKSVVKFAEIYTKREFLTKTFKTFRDSFPGASISSFPISTHMHHLGFELRRSKLQSVEQIQYLKDNVLTTVDTSTYYATNETDFSSVELIDGEVWPNDADNRFQSIEITFKAGFGDNFTDIPENLRGALLQHFLRYFSDRGDCTDASCPVGKNLPIESKAVYDFWRIIDIGG